MDSYGDIFYTLGKYIQSGDRSLQAGQGLMVHFAVSSMFFHGYPLDEIFAYTEEAGFNGIEFWIETPHFWIRGCPVMELIRYVQAYPKLTTDVHAPVLDLNPCSINSKVAEVSRQYACEALDLAEKIGAKVVTFHPGRRTVKRVPARQEYERFELFLDTLRSAAAGKRVRVSMENMEQSINALICSPEAMRELLDAEPWLGFTLDTSHALAASIDEAVRYIDLCGERLSMVHLSGAENGRTHLPVSGNLEVKEIVRRMKDCGYQGTISLEIEDRNFFHELSLEERITLLMRDLASMQGWWE
jgi:sugar phosphate isomerase/epimerase